MIKTSKKITAILLLLLTVSFLFTGCSFDENTNIEESLEEITVRLPIPILEAGLTHFYAGIDLGFYEEQGLDVTFEPGTSETNPIKMVTAGIDDFGVIGGPDAILTARAQGTPVVAIATLYKDSNFPVILTLADSGLIEVEDLEGKDVGFFYGHISTDVLRNFFRQQDVSVNEIDVGFDYSQLITGSIDAQWAFRTTAGVSLPAQGVEVNVISPADYGITSHGLTIFTTENMIETNREVVEAFISLYCTCETL